VASERIGREPEYDAFAAQFLTHAADGFYNAHYDRPACLELLGDVAGKVVLDAGCGPGLYASELVARGARVIGFDVSPQMVQISRERVSAGDFRVHALGDPIGWLPDGAVDLVLCALAIEHVNDRVAALRELCRVLAPGGALVLSLQHPVGSWLRHGGSYFDQRLIRETWNAGWQVSYWTMPLETTCEEIHQAGFLIERLLEPRPAPHAAQLDPERYEQLSREPYGFLALRLRPASRG
jgi:ubiquinone/menaquinone biosynthesis C-methylase UbiE